MNFLKTFFRNIVCGLIFIVITMFFITIEALYSDPYFYKIILYIVTVISLIFNLQKESLNRTTNNVKKSNRKIIILIKYHYLGVLVYLASFVLLYLSIFLNNSPVLFLIGLLIVVFFNIINFNNNKISSFNKKETLSSFIASRCEQNAGNWTGLLIFLFLIFLSSILMFSYYFNKESSSISWWLMPLLVTISTSISLMFLFFSKNRSNLMIQASEYTHKYYMEQLYESHKNNPSIEQPLAQALINSASRNPTSNLTKNSKNNNLETIETLKLVTHILNNKSQ